MREILFRGKPINERSTLEWIEGGIKTKDGRAFIIGMSSKMRVEAMEVYPNTVGQYTGMNIYGQKIFEGDILKLDYIGPGRGVQGVAEVVFKYGKFCMPWGHRKELVPLDGFANTTMEIIGNVHDNPELLGGGE